MGLVMAGGFIARQENDEEVMHCTQAVIASFPAMRTPTPRSGGFSRRCLAPERE